MNRFVLYYQSVGANPHVQAPEVLCVGSMERCEAVKKAVLADPLYRLIQLRDGQSGVMRIVPQSGGRSVVAREVPFDARIASLGPVQPV